MADIKEIKNDGVVKKRRRFDKRDWATVREFIIDEHRRRKKAREDRERQWDEIDRQIAMKPDVDFKKLPNGKIDHKKLWMSEMELPLQAQALEVLTADVARLLFGDQGKWFRAHAEMTDDYLEKVDFTSMIVGDKAEVPSQIDQDNADKLVQGFVTHMLRQSDFFTGMDRINAEALKYGVGVGRAMVRSKNVYTHTSRGVQKQGQKIPVLVPASIRNHYIDDRPPSRHSTQVLSESHISEDYIRYENIALAANSGSTNPDDEDGGWMPDVIRTIEPDDKGFVQLIEMEGDIVVPRKTVRSMVIPGAIVTVAVGGESGGEVTSGVIRFRFRKRPHSSYMLFPYHYEGAHDTYPTSPLMKGRPIQIMATDAANRLLDSAALKNAPPVGYDRSDMVFAQEGGPSIHPYASWQTTDEVRVYDEIGGDPNALAGSLRLGIQLYSELTGVLPARLGAQTVSHTTAFAKEAEIQRGASRTVDYVNHTGRGPVERWLGMAYDLGRDAMKGDMSLHIPAYGGFVEIDKSKLPERAIFEWFGSAGPAEEQQHMQSKLQALQLALQMDQLNIATGGQPVVDVSAAIREVLREGKWTDVDVITRTESLAGGNPAQPVIPGTEAASSGTTSTALQALAFGNNQAA